jgi:hypothetical protein
MAVLDNGLETIEVGSYAWRVIINNNFAKTATIDMLDNLAKADLSNVDSQVVIDKVKENDGAGSGLDADLLDGKQGSDYLSINDSEAAYTTNQDIKFTDENVGIVLTARGDPSKAFRIYVNDDGSIHTEQV